MLRSLLASLLLFVPGVPLFAAEHTAPPAGWHVTVPAKGGLIFPMKVNGRGPYQTVFDTGAVNVMSADFAKAIGLTIRDKSTDFGAIGGPVKARTVHVDTLTVGELNIANCPAALGRLRG